MFDFNWSEIALIGVVALVFIGPKDMPTAIRGVSNLLKKGRKLAAEFQTHVDAMMRDADLGEARESFRELRSMNLRGQVMKALDSDGALRRTLSENPLSAVPAATNSVLPGALTEAAMIEPVAIEPAAPGSVPVSGAEMLRRRNTPHGTTPVIEGNISELSESEDPAPPVIPPATVRRMRRVRAAPPAPAFLPPGLRRPTSDLF